MGIAPIIPVVITTRRRREADEEPCSYRDRHHEPQATTSDEGFIGWPEVCAVCIGLLLGLLAIAGVHAMVEFQQPQPSITSRSAR
jgi:hypothetical protein